MRRALIGQLSSALWLAEYLKRKAEMLNEAFVASSGDMITDYDLYCLFMHRVARRVPCKHYHVCICDRRNDKQQALLYTAKKIAFESSVANSLNKKSYLQAVSQKRQIVLEKLELPHFIETVFVHSWHCKLLFQVQETVLRNMRWGYVHKSNSNLSRKNKYI